MCSLFENFVENKNSIDWHLNLHWTIIVEVPEARNCTAKSQKASR